jgi:hypothetical protein
MSDGLDRTPGYVNQLEGAMVKLDGRHNMSMSKAQHRKKRIRRQASRKAARRAERALRRRWRAPDRGSSAGPVSPLK